MTERLSKDFSVFTAAGWLLPAAVLLVGCQKQEIQAYRVPKENPLLAESEPHEHAPQAFPKLEWQLPAGWEDRGPGRMTVASFSIPGKNGPGAEVSIMPMPGERELRMLVNIVRQGSGMKPLSSEELAKAAEKVQVGDSPASLVDLTETAESGGSGKAERIYVAILARAGTTWLIKFAGTSEVVSLQKEPFLGFLKSIKFHETQEASMASAGPAPRATLPLNPSAGPAKPQWNVPPNWREVPASELLLAKFILPGPGGTNAEVTVSVFGGSAGGVLPNVNRWRKQMNLPEVSDSDLDTATSSLDVVGGKAILVDMNGTDSKSGRKARLTAVILPQGSRTWFYKMLGDPAVAEQEKAAFLKFVQTAKHPDAA